MIIPLPAAGLVVRYGFLWSDEGAGGVTEGKDRPCVIVAASRSGPSDVTVLLCPVTHTAPQDDAAKETSVLLALGAAARLKLDDRPHWIRVHELNRFVWPGYDLRSIPGRSGEVAYGMLAEDEFEALRRRVRDVDARLRRVQMRD